MNAIFITVRSNSSRLPNKCYKKIKDKHVIEYVINQAKKSKLADSIILCTTELPEDDSLCEIATKNNINFFRGSEIDKLDRWHAACKEFNVDFFTTADGDDLFCSHELMDMAFIQNQNSSCDFIYGNNLVCGSFTYGVKYDALKRVCEIKDTDDTEMMWVYFTETGLFDTSPLKNVPDVYKRTDIRMTLDYEDDFKFFKTVIEKMQMETFDTRDVLSFLDANKDLIDINFHLEQQWKQNQNDKINLKIKNGR